MQFWKGRKKGLGKGEEKLEGYIKSTESTSSTVQLLALQYCLSARSTLYSLPLPPILLNFKMTCAHLGTAVLCSRWRMEGARGEDTQIHRAFRYFILKRSRS